MNEFAFLVIPNFILFWIYLLTFSKNKFLNKNYYLIVIAWIIILLYQSYDWYSSREKWQEISHFWNVVIAISWIIFILPILIYLRYKNIKSIFIIFLLLIISIISIVLFFFILALTNNIWGM